MLDADLNNVPNLITSLQGPLQQIEQHFLSNQVTIESWIRKELKEIPPPIYCSVDLRNAGFKLAPVDTNLFPAGFNNLNLEFIPLCIQAVQAMLDEICPTIKRILLVPEDHTRNIYYYENISIISRIFAKAGFEVRIGSLLEGLVAPKEITLPSKRKLVLEPIYRVGGCLMVENFSPCLVLLNNDLSAGVPEILLNLDQTVMPPLHAGWHSRLKSKHFQHYQEVVREFCQITQLDPWLLSPLFRYCGNVNFMAKESELCLFEQANELFEAINTKYKEYNIKEKPFLVVKADRGTYGMAVMMIQDSKDLLRLNRKDRTKMASTKGGQDVTEVIIQEGIYTFETWGKNNSVAEPVVYMIGKYVVGGFYRVHANKGVNENLNAPGMNFEPLAFARSCYEFDEGLSSGANRFYAYGVVGRLAMIAAARELKDSGFR